jgi:hypothetical protein
VALVKRAAHHCERGIGDDLSCDVAWLDVNVEERLPRLALDLVSCVVHMLQSSPEHRIQGKVKCWEVI